MLKDSDFVKYGLENLMITTKHAVDIFDTEKDSLESLRCETMKALDRHKLASDFEKKYIIHGHTDNLFNSYEDKFIEAGLDTTWLRANNPSVLVNSLKKSVDVKVSDLYKNISSSEYMRNLSCSLENIKKTVLGIYPDEVTTYMYADVAEFSKTRVTGYNKEVFRTKLSGIQALLGALNTIDERKFLEVDVRQHLRWHLINAGFSFNGSDAVAPKDEEAYYTDSLENLGWTPSDVNSVNDTLESCLTLDGDCKAMSYVMSKMNSQNPKKNVSVIVENCCAIRNILSYTKNTLYCMCRQYLNMVRSYR